MTEFEFAANRSSLLAVPHRFQMFNLFPWRSKKPHFRLPGRTLSLYFAFDYCSLVPRSQNQNKTACSYTKRPPKTDKMTI